MDKNIRAVLVYVDFTKSPNFEVELAEFHSLAQAAAMTIVETMVCRKERPSPKYFIGQGKVEEIGRYCALTEIDVIIFNHRLSPLQERNLEQYFKRIVLDRTKLILNIFDRRARSFEGKLQVELARLEHLATRLVGGWTHLERQRGGIGLRGGPGEKQLEIDRRVLRQRISSLKKRLEKLKNQRMQNRKLRKKSNVPTIALVGYTNAGKSTLFNGLVATAKSSVANMLFTTLDPLLRRIYLADVGNVVIVDTVGFIADLPHELIEAFHATLEEVKETDLLLHVIDVADPDRNIKIDVVNDVLVKIGAHEVPQIEVMNKIDQLDNFESRLDYGANGLPSRVWLSASENIGISHLEEAIAQFLGKKMKKINA